MGVFWVCTNMSRCGYSDILCLEFELEIDWISILIDIEQQISSCIEIIIVTIQKQ